MFRLFRNHAAANTLLSSKLFDQDTFYKAFIKDLSRCDKEVLIESPFITGNRVASLLPIFSKLESRGVRVTVNTRQPSEHEAPFDAYASRAIARLQAVGVQVLFTGGHHRKLAILDRGILWEGSLNILSQSASCEVMRRIKSAQLAEQMISFVKVDKFLK